MEHCPFSQTECGSASSIAKATDIGFDAGGLRGS
jgi:hypothetical protein